MFQKAGDVGGSSSRPRDVGWAATSLSCWNGPMTDETPDVKWHESWAETVLEFGEEYPHGSGLDPDAIDVTPEGCAAFVAERLRGADPEAPRPEGIVLSDNFWITDGDEVVGFLAVRHELTPSLLEEAATSATRCARRGDWRGTPRGPSRSG